MAWLLEPPPPPGALAETFRQLAQGRLILPGAHDPLTALAARAAGFPALYLSGAALSASLGLPDLGLLTLEEVVLRTRQIVRASRLPLLVDVDTGFGEALNALRTARELYEAGAAGLQIEDQEMPKKCGHLSGKRLIPEAEMVEKIRIIKAQVPQLFLLARTDAQALEGIEGVIRRAQAYLEAGADGIFPEALVSREEFRRVREALPGVPLLANLTEFGKTPPLTAQEVFDLGYTIALFPVSSLRVSLKAAEGLFAHLKATGTTQGLPMQTRQELYAMIEYDAYEELDQRVRSEP
jgi:methylisocitrate lyase